MAAGCGSGRDPKASKGALRCPTGVCEKAFLLCEPWALPRSSRSCSPATDLVFLLASFPKGLLLQRSVLFTDKKTALAVSTAFEASKNDEFYPFYAP